jgi:hypothetical protein
MHWGKEPPEPARRRLRGPLPEARGQNRLGRRAIPQDGPCHQRQVGPPRTTRWSKDDLPCGSHHLLGRQGQPFHRPAVAIKGLQLGTGHRQRRVAEEGRVNAWIMNQHGAEGRRPRPRIGADHVVPKGGVEGQGRWLATELPGCLAVRWGGRNGVALGRAREGTDEDAPDGFAPLPTIGGQPRSSRREVARSADDIAWSPGFLPLAEGKAAIADQRFVGGERGAGLLEQTHRQVGLAGLGCLAPDEEAGHRQTRGPPSPHARGNAQGASGSGLPGGGRIVLGRAVPKPRPEEPAEVTGDRTIPTIRVGVKDLCMLYEGLPGLQHLGRGPLPLRPRRPGTPDGGLGQPQRGEPRDHGASTPEQATAQAPPQAMKETEIRANGHMLDHTRQDRVHPVD